MNICFECVQCEADFELDSADLVKDPSLVVCPNCNAKANPEIIEALSLALDELLSQLTRLRKKFRAGFNMEFDDIDDELAELFDDDEGLWSDEVEEEEEED
jgi:hypothetical protein